MQTHTERSGGQIDGSFRIVLLPHSIIGGSSGCCETSSMLRHLKKFASHCGKRPQA
jgi:hypothetical protein